MDQVNQAIDWLRENVAGWSLMKLYVGCAIAGVTVILAQSGLSLFGFGGTDGDVDADADVEAMEGDDSLGILSVRTLSSFLGIFGLVGAGGTVEGWHGGLTAAIALLAGLSMMMMVAFLMRSFMRLKSSGNLDPTRAIGSTATVYLRVPEKGQGTGKITVSIQGRTAEYNATSVGDALPTGSTCRLVAMPTDDTFEVEPVT